MQWVCGVLPSYIGVGADACIIEGYLLLKSSDVIRNLNIAKIPWVRNRCGIRSVASWVTVIRSSIA